MNNRVSIAVVITTYNSPEYLRRVLEGYRRQTRYPDELIVADDGSTDETNHLVKAFAACAPFKVRHVWHEDRGFRAAKIRNEAVKASSSGYLVFTDGDCIPHPCFIEDHIRLMKTGCFVQGKRMLVSQSISRTFAYSGALNMLRLCLCRHISGCHHLIRLPGYSIKVSGLRGVKTCNLALFRADIEAVNGFNEAFVGWGREDAELVARLYTYGLTRRDSPFSAIVFHLWHPENSRVFLTENDKLLEETIAGINYRCTYGIIEEGNERRQGRDADQ